MTILRHFRKKALARALRLVAIILICPTVLHICSLPSAALELSAKSAVLIEADSTHIIYQKNAHTPMGMASTTKIMTALVACNALPPEHIVTVSADAVNIEGSSIYLTAGERLSVEDLLLALLLESANDAAVALAVEVAGSVGDFVALMQSTADSLGLKNTRFENPHGLYSPEHYTTAYELAIIASHALRHPLIRRIVSTKSAIIPRGVTENSPLGAGIRYLKNHNRLLSLYPDAVGVKTGYTKKTGRTLVSAAERDGLLLIAVTLDAPDDWQDHASMLDLGFSLYERVTAFECGEFRYPFPLCGGEDSTVWLTNAAPITLLRKKGEGLPNVRVLAPRRFELAPLPQGSVLALLEVSYGSFTASSPLVTLEAVDAKKYEKGLFKLWKK